jgi:acetoin utilization protein AcuB
MQVQDVMTETVLTIEADESIARAEALMRDASVHQLVVTGRHSRVVGVLSRGDLNGAPVAGRVEDFMSRHLFTVHPDTLVGTAAALMRRHAVGSLPVLDGQRLVGIITVSDMLGLVDDSDSPLSTR